MREYQIKIEPFEYIAMQEFTISRGVDGHAKAELAMLIRDDKEEPYVGMLTGETWVKITGVSGQEGGAGSTGTVLFHGIVTDFRFSHDSRGTTLALELASGTVLMDLKPHFRVFQNETASCAQIHRQLAGAYQDGQVSFSEGSGNLTLGVLIQYQETDWEFLKRIAARTGLYLVPDALRKGVKYTVGLPEGIKRAPQPGQTVVRLAMDEYMEKSCNGMASLQAADMLELIFTDREIYQLGDSIPYQGKEYFICHILTEYKGGECVHTYRCRGKDAIRRLPVPHPGLAGCSFDAIVTDVKADKVQIEIAQDEWKAADGKKWFPYSTVYSSPDGTGWYCMPEKGDSVRLYVPGREEDSFVLSAVHKETDSARQNPDYKSLKTKYGKEVLFTPDAILMTNNKGMTVEMNDRDGITITSDKDIVIEAEENLTVSSANASLLIAADDILQVRQGSTAMTLGGDISFTGGEFRIQ